MGRIFYHRCTQRNGSCIGKDKGESRDDILCRRRWEYSGTGSIHIEYDGDEARGFEDGKSFMEALAFETPELILLDIMLPGEDGLSLLKKLKNSAKTKEIPVIMVTAKGAEYDKVVGLDGGADDYVTKPF